MKDTSTSRYDRPCEHLARNWGEQAPWETDGKRGNLNLAEDRAEHRRYHSLFEDLLN